MPITPCPCGLAQAYMQCCGAFIEQGKLPATAEQLMRSRYTAYTLENMQYIQQTMSGAALKTFDANLNRRFAAQAEWQQLTVLATQQGQATDTLGYVEFIARYQQDGKIEMMHERSEFRKIDQRWYYVAGQPGTVKLGRNDLCYCGSGKKYKKCCAA